MPWIKQKRTHEFRQILDLIFPLPEVTETSSESEKHNHKQRYAIVQHQTMCLCTQLWGDVDVKANWHINICPQRSSAAMQAHRPWLLISTKAATKLGWVAGTWARYIGGPATAHSRSLSGVLSGGLQDKS